jgi:hypothetical protein
MKKFVFALCYAALVEKSHATLVGKRVRTGSLCVGERSIHFLREKNGKKEKGGMR